MHRPNLVTVAQLNAEAQEYETLAPKLGEQLELAVGELIEARDEKRLLRLQKQMLAPKLPVIP